MKTKNNAYRPSKAFLLTGLFFFHTLAACVNAGSRLRLDEEALQGKSFLNNTECTKRKLQEEHKHHTCNPKTCMFCAKEHKQGKCDKTKCYHGSHAFLTYPIDFCWRKSNTRKCMTILAGVSVLTTVGLTVGSALYPDDQSSKRANANSFNHTTTIDPTNIEADNPTTMLPTATTSLLPIVHDIGQTVVNGVVATAKNLTNVASNIAIITTTVAPTILAPIGVAWHQSNQNKTQRWITYEHLDYWTANGFSVNTIQYLLDSGLDINAKTNDGTDFTFLMMAADWDNLEVIKFLLANGADIDAQSSIGRTALHYVANNNPGLYTEDIIKELLKNNANPCARDKNGRRASYHAKSDNVKRLLQAAEAKKC